MTETTIKKYIPFGEPIKPETAQGGFGFIPNGIREKNIFFYHPDHLGSSSYITGQDGKVSQHTEYIAFGEILFDEHNTEHTMPYLFNGKELDQETGLYYYGARYYDPKTSIFLNVDPLAEKTMTPYAYTNNNPIMLVDPTGMEAEAKNNDDPIYDKKGNKVGDDGKNNNKAYIVKGSILKQVKKATKNGQYYTASLEEGNNVVVLPTNGVADDIINSVDDTITSKLEHGGHAYKGEENATRWDIGTKPQEVKNNDGDVVAVRASVAPFKVNGVQKIPKDASNLEYWWHVHPDAKVGGVNLGASNPSPKDYDFQGILKNAGYKGNTFVIGARNQKVTFYNNQKTILQIRYETFKKILGKK